MSFRTGMTRDQHVGRQRKLSRVRTSRGLGAGQAKYTPARTVSYIYARAVVAAGIALLEPIPDAVRLCSDILFHNKLPSAVQFLCVR